MIRLRNILRETVFMRILLAFCSGVILYEFTSSKLTVGIALLLIVLLASAYLFFALFLINRYNFTFKFYNGLIIYIICGLISFQLAYFQDLRNHQSYSNLIPLKKCLVKVHSNGRLTKKNCLYEVQIIDQYYTIANSILSLKDDSIYYKMGDTLQVTGMLEPIDFPNHPGQFDYKKYLIRKHIYHRIQTTADNVKLVSKQSNFEFLEFSNRCRGKLLAILKSNIEDEDSYEMAAALLLGERGDLDENLMKSYSDTGTIHIISVSGLHVGIIFLVLQYLLRHLPFLKNEYLKFIVIIICIWFYATLTGLPASVIRSALMISFHTLGKTISSKTNSINHVAASAIVLLSINTNYLFDIGFQLSYLAVFGIMYLQKSIHNLYTPNNYLVSFVWTTTSVSVAAQLFTLPLCIYYFHQFPNYFILANLLAIPLSSIALYASISNLAFASVPLLNKLCEWVLVYSIKLLNSYLIWLSNLPLAVSKMERIDLLQVALYCLLLLFIFLYIKEKLRSSLIFTFFTLICITLYGLYQQSHLQHNHLWVTKSIRSINYTLEDKTSFTHYVSNRVKIKTLNQQLTNWRNFKPKHQKIKIIQSRQFQLQIGNVNYSNKDDQPVHFGNNYHRICLK